MDDIIDLSLAALAILLGGAALALGAQIIRQAWRGVGPLARAALPGPGAGGGAAAVEQAPPASDARGPAREQGVA